MNDLVIVHPMSSISGVVAYLDYTAGTNKGGIKQGDLLNGVFGLGMPTAERTAYTSETIIENVTGDAYKLALHAVAGAVQFLPKGVKQTDYNVPPYVTADAKVIRANGKIEYVTLAKTSDGKIDPNTSIVSSVDEEGKAILPVNGLVAGDRVVYKSEEFQMDHVPAQDIPSLKPHVNTISLIAKPRRIAVYYDQITAYQAKTDYGFSLDKQIA